jgi:hypothetical protein
MFVKTFSQLAARLFHYLRISQSGDFGVVISRLTKNRVGVLTEERRRAGGRDGRF